MAELEVDEGVVEVVLHVFDETLQNFNREADSPGRSRGRRPARAVPRPRRPRRPPSLR